MQSPGTKSIHYFSMFLNDADFRNRAARVYEVGVWAAADRYVYSIWVYFVGQRQSTLKPIKDEMDELERKKVNRLISALKKFSENDMKMADVMRSAGLL